MSLSNLPIFYFQDRKLEAQRTSSERRNHWRKGRQGPKPNITQRSHDSLRRNHRPDKSYVQATPSQDNDPVMLNPVRAERQVYPAPNSVQFHHHPLLQLLHIYDVVPGAVQQV